MPNNKNTFLKNRILIFSNSKPNIFPMAIIFIGILSLSFILKAHITIIISIFILGVIHFIYRILRNKNDSIIQQANQRYQALFDNMLNGFAYCKMIYDSNSEPVDFIYLAVNPAFSKLTGLVDVTNKSVSQVIPGLKESNPELFTIYGRVAKTGVPEELISYVPQLNIWFSVSVYSPEKDHFVALFENITQKHQDEIEREYNIEILKILNSKRDLKELIKSLTTFLHRISECECVGIRLRDGEDFPYYDTRGFSEEFVKHEMHLCARNSEGNIIHDKNGKPVLECMCGNILCGRIDASKPFFTIGGSFWSNGTTRLLSSTTDTDRQAHTRNYCNGMGYESVALVPLKTADVTYGLVQFNDHKKDRFSIEMIGMLERLCNNIAIGLAQLKTESSLRDSETKFQYLIENINDLVCEINPDNNIIYANKRFKDVLDYEPSELLNVSFLSILNQAEHEITTISLGEIFENHLPRKFIQRLRHKNGEWRWFESSAAYMEYGLEKHYVALILRDITERIQTEQLLAEERERLAVTLQSIADGVITIDTNSKITMFNNAAGKLTGWNFEEAIGHSLNQIYTIESAETHMTYLNTAQESLTTGKITIQPFNVLLINKYGNKITISDSSAPIINSLGNIIGAVLVFRDMTENQKLTETIVRTQKLESIGILAGGIAHDFNNLLCGLFGFMEIAEEYISLKNYQEAETALHKASTIFNRTKALTKQLLTFSKGGAPIKKSIQIDSTIENSVKFALSGSNCTYTFKVETPVPLCNCDENQISQVIDNIIINAKQAMPNGGNIKIVLQEADLRKDIYPMIIHEGKHIKISITDSGAGIPENILPRIFDPFFTTKKNGNGLGLATVYSIIRQHEGWIDVESKVDIGTTFNIFIPSTTLVMADSKNKLQIAGIGHGKILILDDEDFIREYVSEVLTKAGFTVVTARNSEEAIIFFKEAVTDNKKFDATILDLTIPGGLNGIDMYNELIKADPEAVIIASSGYSDDPIMADPQNFGFKDRIVKPYQKIDLMEVLTKNIKNNFVI